MLREGRFAVLDWSVEIFSAVALPQIVSNKQHDSADATGRPSLGLLAAELVGRQLLRLRELPNNASRQLLLLLNLHLQRFAHTIH